MKQDPGTISTRRLEVSRASLEQARARVAASEADIRRAIEQKGGDDDADNAILKIAQSAVIRPNWTLTAPLCRQPRAASSTDLRADVGQFAGTGSPGAYADLLHDVWIAAEFTENNLGHIRPGTRRKFCSTPCRAGYSTARCAASAWASALEQAPPPGTLPTVQNDRDWLRQAQRFPVIVRLRSRRQDEALYEQLRIGGQATVIAYSEGHGVLAFLGKASTFA